MLPRTNRDGGSDVVVVGSGGAGLTAALAAAAGGASVIVLEKSDRLGGATAMSGGTTWVPDNHLAAAAGIDDSRREALDYLLASSGDRVNRLLVEAFVDAAPRMLRFLDRTMPGGFYLARDGDYHAETAGAKEMGRSVLPAPFDPDRLAGWAEWIRRVELPLDVAEAYGSLNPPEDAPEAALVTAGLRWTRGRALVGALLRACLDRGVRVLPGHRAQGLLHEQGRVVGVKVHASRGPRQFRVAKGVVLASGGFEWDRGLVAGFLPGSVVAPGSPPGTEGDGLRMAMALGAGLGSMGEAWWSPMIRVPGETYDGRDYARMVVSQRLFPRSIVVNRAGLRFADEAMSYHDFGALLMAVDHRRGTYQNRPAWLVFDLGYRRRYGSACVGPGDPDPAWLQPCATLEELARCHGIDPVGLQRTVEEFNRHASAGRDPMFHRGETHYSHWKGDRSETGVRRTLGPIDRPPFYAVELHAGTIGTRGGPLTDGDGRVLDVAGRVIEGLFAAGNVAASGFGLLYPGAGGTLGPALTFGYLAGRAIAGAGATTEAARP